MKRYLFIGLIFVLCGAGLAWAQPLSLDEGKPVTEGEFAIMLVRAMGQEDELPSEAQAGDLIILLERLGIAPLDNWRPDAKLTYGRMATILSRAMNLPHQSVNDTDKCFNNVCEINKGWYIKHKETNGWPELGDFLASDYFKEGKPTCPFGLVYEDKAGNHLVAIHNHPHIEEVEKAYLADLGERDIMVFEHSPSDLVSGLEARRLIESILGNILFAKGYLTPPTPILPKEALRFAGGLVFIVYEKGLVDDRKVKWPIQWSKDEPLQVAIVYSHDATLSNNKSIKMYINGIEVDACSGTWVKLTPDDYIWVGSQSQTGLFPASIYIYNLKIYDLIKTDFVSESGAKPPADKSILLWSLMDRKEEILSPKKGISGDISRKIYSDTSQSFVSGEGFISNLDGEYVLFPNEGNINLLKGTIEFQLKPTFISSTTEHALLNNVRWDAKNGASGFYFYYQPEEKS